MRTRPAWRMSSAWATRWTRSGSRWSPARPICPTWTCMWTCTCWMRTGRSRRTVCSFPRRTPVTATAASTSSRWTRPRSSSGTGISPSSSRSARRRDNTPAIISFPATKTLPTSTGLRVTVWASSIPARASTARARTGTIFPKYPEQRSWKAWSKRMRCTMTWTTSPSRPICRSPPGKRSPAARRITRIWRRAPGTTARQAGALKTISPWARRRMPSPRTIPALARRP